MNNIKIFFLVLIVIFSLNLFGQKNGSKLIRKYTTEQGLSSNYIYRLIQDNQGFIWIGTEEGLNKFDGKNFTLFSTKKGRYLMSNNRTQALLLAPDGNIWAGTSNGLNIYDYSSDSIIIVKDNTTPLKLIYNDITFMRMSPDNQKIWIGTYGNGVHFFDWNKKTFNRLILPVVKPLEATLNVMNILEDDNKRLWIGTQHNGIYRYNLSKKTIEHFNLNNNSEFIRIIFQDSFRRIWIGTSNGCYIYNETTNLFDLVTYPLGLSNTSISIINEDKDGNIWLGGEMLLVNFSVRSFSLKEKFPFQSYSEGESNSKLNSFSLSSLLFDRDNNVWIGTVWGGLNMMQGTTPKFKLFKHQAEEINTLPKSPVISVCKYKQDELLIGTNGMGLYKMNMNSNDFVKFNINNKVSQYIFQAILVDSQGDTWLGTYKNGILKLNNKGQYERGYIYNELDVFSLPSNDVRCLFESKKNELWIGTSNGLVKLNIKSGKIEERINLSKRIDIRSITEDNENVLWIGTYGAGVITYNPANKSVNNNPIPNNPLIVSDILINGDSIWIGSQGMGLIFFDKKLKNRISYVENDGLSSNYIRSLMRDKEGSIWLGTSKGISKLNLLTKEVLNFNSQDGVQSFEFAERCATKLSDGRFILGGLGGINVFNPLEVQKNDRCPKVIFTKLSVFGQVITPSNNKKLKSPLRSNITIADLIELKYNQSVFSIEFIGINYNATQKIQYAYFLEGSDKRWNYLGNQNVVTFRNLAPGNYVLRVKASSPDGVWNDENYSKLSIIVEPPIWKTWWAYLIYFILFVSALYFTWQLLTLRIRTTNTLKIERAKREKDEELHQEKLQFFTNISHEFRTPLTLLIGPLEKLQMQEVDEKKNKQINLMLRNAKRLLLMVNQLLDFRKAEKGQMSLKVQYLDIVAFIREIIMSYEEIKVKKNIQLEFVFEESIMMTWFDAEFIDKSLFNLLSNAFKFTPDFGSININICSEKDTNGKKLIEIAVADNGIGIREEDIDNIFERFYQGKVKSGMQVGSGIGLHLTRNLVELHHGSIRVKSIPNLKTVFTISIPSDESGYNANELSEERSILNQQLNPETLFNTIDPKNRFSENESNEKLYKILLVEDNQDIRSYIIDILREKYFVDQAENGVIGLKLVSENEYALIITDLMMPEMDGIEMCKQLKSSIETDHIPIIMLTAKDSIESRIEGINVGADSYISKPFHPEHLQVRVNKLIEQRELFKERFSKITTFGKLQKHLIVSKSLDDQFLKKAIELTINKMVDTDFNGDALANDLFISRMGLHRKIKALTGQSTGEFIRNIRLKKACELLVIPGKNISEVCYDVGFNSPSYFTSCFTESFKMTPSEYVKDVNKKNNS